MRYFREKVSATGSDRLISTLVSGFSTSLCCRSVTEPDPISPAAVNLTPSLVHSICTRMSVRRDSACRKGTKSRTRLGDCVQVLANALKLGRRHLDSRSIVGIWNSQVLLINVHEFDVVFADPVLIWALEDEVDHIRSVFRLQCQNIIRLCCTEDFHEGCEVDSQSDVAIAAKWRESL